MGPPSDSRATLTAVKPCGSSFRCHFACARRAVQSFNSIVMQSTVCCAANRGMKSYAAQVNAVEADTAWRAAHPCTVAVATSTAGPLAPSSHSSVSSIFKIDFSHPGVDCLPLRVAPGISRSPVRAVGITSPEHISRQCTGEPRGTRKRMTCVSGCYVPRVAMVSLWYASQRCDALGDACAGCEASVARIKNGASRHNSFLLYRHDTP